SLYTLAYRRKIEMQGIRRTVTLRGSFFGYFLSEKKVAPKKRVSKENERKPKRTQMLRRLSMTMGGYFAPHDDTRGSGLPRLGTSSQ
ncbi:MAG: hypothetical protein LBS73_03285, partial [Campylobacteraceae bacterium]|nr:hypothetical protein [Campylobacteraceae bacterium]